MKELLKNLTNRQVAVVLFLTGFLLYFLSLFNGFVGDDHVYILNNLLMRKFDLHSFFLGSSYYTGDITQLGGIYYKPLFTTITSFLLITSNGNAFPFHLVQVLIHLTNSFMVFLLFKHFFKKQLAFFLSLLFLVHPGNVESVVYIADLQDVLFFFCGIPALLLILKKNLNQKYALLTGFLLLLSLLSKESGILFIPTILILSFLNERKNLKPLAIIVPTVLTSYFFMRFVIAQVTINHMVIAPIMDAPILIRLQTIPKIIFSYIKLYFFPKDLSWAQHWIVNKLTFLDFYFPLMVILLLLTILIFVFKKSTTTAKKPLIFFFFVSFFGLGLHSQIIPLDFTFAERWFYFTSLGFIGLTGVIIQKIKVPPKYNTYVCIFALIVLIILSTRTLIRTLNWKDDYTLTTHDITVDKESLTLENNLGFELLKKQQYEKAITHFQRSIELFPHTSNNSPYVNMAFAYAKLNRKDESLTTYKKALEISDHHTTYQNYLSELIRQEKIIEARELLEKALAKYPNDPKLYLLAAVIEYKSNQKDQAIEALKKADQLQKGSANYLFSLISKNQPINL